nr:ribonuclease H-like domain-containing protein [Tanacetum cinerariifolium]
MLNMAPQHEPYYYPGPIMPPAAYILAAVVQAQQAHVPMVQQVQQQFMYSVPGDGSLNRYKARLVAKGRSQQQGIDCDETFSSVVKLATIRTVLSLAVSRDWPIHQLDVKNAFFHGHLSETVYMHQPHGFVDPNKPDYVCHLQRSFIVKLTPLYLSFIEDLPYLLLYVDDIILTTSSSTFLQRIIASFHSEFAMTDLGSLNYFLGISSQRYASGLFLSQSKFIEEILEQAHMQNCNSYWTPVDTESKLGLDGEPVSDPTLYRKLAGALQYLIFTRTNLSYVVQQVCLYMHDPRDPHFTASKRILRYVRGTLDYGLQLHVSSTTQLTAYTDADWVGCPVTRRSTSGDCVFLGDNLLSWSAKRQVTLSRSSAEAEYRGVANVVAETAWICNLLRELHTPLFTATLVYCDNVIAVYMSAKPVQHQRTKHIEIDIHFVRDFVASGQDGRDDCMGKAGISSLMKCTFAIRQMAYGVVPDSLDEYLQMGATTAHDSLRIFCKVMMNLYGSIGCTHWLWANCPFAYRAQFYRGDHGVSGMNNDVNVLCHYPLFNDLKSGRAPDVLFVANNVLYKRGYYLTDGIYSQWSVLIKSIKNPGTHDHKRIFYKTKHEATKKDVERAFGVLKQKWKLTLNIRLEQQHRDDDPVKTHEEWMQDTQEIINGTSHLSLKADLVERILNNAN